MQKFDHDKEGDVIQHDSIEEDILDPDLESDSDPVGVNPVIVESFGNSKNNFRIQKPVCDIEEESIRLDEFIKGNPNDEFNVDFSKMPPEIAEKLLKKMGES